MTGSQRRSPLQRVLATTVGLGMATSATLAASGSAFASNEVPQAMHEAGRYVVTLVAPPAASYEGGVKGLDATKPSEGEKLDSDSTDVKEYKTHLQIQQEKLADSADVDIDRSYTTAVNGFAADLTAQQAAKLASSPGVLSVAKDARHEVTTNDSPDFLGMPKLWQEAGGQTKAGSGVVVGVLDTGIWPESASFTPNRTPIPADWNGECVEGEEFTADDCNSKLIGARYYVDGFGAENVSPDEFLSPRDGDGHGSHTASTAAGNAVRNVTVDGIRFGNISGMAPGAKIAAYKVCWTAAPGGDDGCFTSDMVAAIEDAVDDGVDVINFSIGSTTESTVFDATELAFLNAAAAGVFVSASAGNSGPGASTLDHPSPWLTTVAASTHKISEQKLVLGDGREFIGASSTAGLPDLTPMVLAEDSAATGVPPATAALCGLGTLDPDVVAGQLVVCLRGVVDRVEKSLEVRNAGGAGMVMINPSPNSLNGDLHYVPSVHLPDTALAPVTAYVDAGSAEGQIVPLEAGESDTQVPVVAPFSSRGPSTTTRGDILKPDVAAPGVDVLAAVTPYNHEGRNYDLISGTSMAAPHIAGIAAVLKDIHPRWSPMMIKSAMMTTARDTVGTTSPFDQGAGNVRPTVASRPLAVLDHGVLDWLGYLENEGIGDIPGVDPISGTDLNQASIASGTVFGTLVTKRTFKSVSDRTQVFRFSEQVPGFDVRSSQPQLTLKKGQSKTVTFTFTRTDAPLAEYSTGSVKYTASGKHGGTIRMPVALQPVAVSAPAEVTGSGTSGSTTYEVISAVPELAMTVHGLVAGEANEGAGAQNAEVVYEYDVAAGTTAARFDLVADDQAADLDLFAITPSGGVLASASGAASERITVEDPEAGLYTLVVQVFASPGGAETSWTLNNYAVPDADAGNLTVSPNPLVGDPGESATVTATWAGLTADTPYLGYVSYEGATDRTYVTID